MVRSLRVVAKPLGVAHIEGAAAAGVAGGVAAPFGGVVTFVVAAGQRVQEGAVVATIEAMKLEAAVTTPYGGLVESRTVPDQAQVEGGDLLLVIG